MAKRTLECFLPEYLSTVYGDGFEGSLPVWNKQTKQARFFDRTSVSTLVQCVRESMDHSDLYLGMATQPSDLGAGKRGGNGSVVQVSAVFADIDFASAKESAKRYVSDEETAQKILAEFPYVPTLIQNSGGGLQAIWVLKTPLICKSAADRKHAARVVKDFHRKLAKLFGQHGYEIDDCSDIARVYRVPLSINHKYGEPRSVKVLTWNPAARLDIAVMAAAQNPRVQTSDKAYDRNADHAMICQHCPWYDHQTHAGAVSASEPDWVAAGSITAACNDGRALFHEHSKDHPQYDQREADRKFDHIERDLQPFTCAAIADSYGGSEFCASCEWQDQITSPVQLGRERFVILLQQKRAAPEGGWPDQTKDGRPRAGFRNAILCLLRLGVEIRYDLFRMRISVNGNIVQEFSGDMNDDALAYLRKLATDMFGFDPGKTHIADAAHTISLENAFHPIRDYLDVLVWDGKARLARILVDYLGAEDTEINRAFALAVFVAAVRRVRVPGTKFDTMLVLEGPQGSGKSTAILIMAGEGNFSDQSIIGLDQKIQGELLQGIWLFEVAELSGLKHTDSNDLKSFLSRDTDRFRAAYARFTSSNRRQVVFIGTTNDDTYLKDQTGNRRFWPVQTGTIDLEGLRRDRDQFWAEAAHLETHGHPISLPEHLWDAANALQAARLPVDPWLDHLVEINGVVHMGDEVRVSTTVLFDQSNLNIPAGLRKDHQSKRLARVMAALGWTGPETLRIEGRVQRGYRRPAETYVAANPEF